MVNDPPFEIAIVIINWNTRDLLRRCLDSIARDVDRPRTQIIVVDNASSDGSQTMICNDYPSATLVANGHNVGFARANNQGAALAQAPLLLLLNSDAALLPGALRRLNGVFTRDGVTGIVGLRLLNDDGSLQPSGKRFPTLLSTIIGLSPLPERWRQWYDHNRNRRDFAATVYVDEVSGAAMAIGSALFQALGGFDESFFFFGEDIDLCWRARVLGYRTLYLTTAQAIHSWGGARRRTPSIRQGLMSQRAQYRLLRRHRPALEAMALLVVVATFTATRLLNAVLKLARTPSAANNVAAHLYATELLWLIRRSR